MKKLIYSIIFFSATLFGAEGYIFEVDNPVMAKAYFDIFNGMSAIFASDEYLNMLRLVFLLGGFFVFTIGIFNSAKGTDVRKNVLGDYTKYLVAGTLLLTIIYGGEKKDLIIESRTTPEYVCPTITNDNYNGYTVQLPGILPEAFSTLKLLGNRMTDHAASVFSNISGNDLINESYTSNTKISFGKETIAPIEMLNNDFENVLIDPKVLYKDFTSDTFGTLSMASILKSIPNEFYQNCLLLLPDSGLSTEIDTALRASGNMQKTIEDIFVNDKIVVYDMFGVPTKSKDIISDIKPKNMLITYNDITGTCGTFYSDLLKKALDEFQTEATICAVPKLKVVTKSDLYTLTSNENLANFVGLSEIATNSALQTAYYTASNGDQLTKQYNYASYKSMAELATKEVGTGYYMAKMLPYIEAALRAVMYAFFPFVFLSILLPGGFQVAKSYLMSILWIELWSPAAAILNMFLNYFAIDQYATSMGGNGLSMFSTPNIINDATMLGAVAGYLYAFIPAITFMIISGTSFMLSGMFDRLTSIYAKNLKTESVLEDIEDMEYAKKRAEKTGEEADFSKIKSKQALINAEKESEHDSMYFKMNNGDFLENARLEQRGENAAVAKAMGKGGSYTGNNLNALQSTGEFKSSSDILSGEVLGSLNKEHLESLSTGETVANFRELEKNKVIDQTGNSYKDLGNVDAAKDIEGISQTRTKTDINKNRFNTDWSGAASISGSTKGVSSADKLMQQETVQNAFGRENYTTNVAKYLGQDKASHDKATINNLNEFGVGALTKSRTNKNIQNTESGLAMTDAIKNAGEKLGVEFKGIADYTDQMKHMETLSALKDNLVTEKTIDSLNSTGENVVNMESTIKAAKSISTFEKNKAIADFYSKKDELFGDNGKSELENFQQYAREKGFANAFNSSIQFGVSETINMSELTEAKIYKESESIGNAEMLQTISTNVFGIKDTAAASGEFWGSIQAGENVLAILALARPISKTFKKTRNEMKNKKSLKEAKEKLKSKNNSLNEKKSNLEKKLEKTNDIKERERLQKKLDKIDKDIEKNNRKISVMEKEVSKNFNMAYTADELEKMAYEKVKAEDLAKERKAAEKALMKEKGLLKYGAGKITEAAGNILNNTIVDPAKNVKNGAAHIVTKGAEGVANAAKAVSRAPGAIVDGVKAAPGKTVSMYEGFKNTLKANLDQTLETLDKYDPKRFILGQNYNKRAAAFISNKVNVGVKSIKQGLNYVEEVFEKGAEDFKNGGAKKAFKTVASGLAEGSMTIAKGTVGFAKHAMKSFGVGIIVDMTANVVYETADKGSFGSLAAGSVSKFFKATGEGMAVALFDTVPYMYAKAIGDEEYANEQLRDMAESGEIIENTVRQGLNDIQNTMTVQLDNGNILETTDIKTGNQITYRVKEDGTEEIVEILDKNGKNIYNEGMNGADTPRLTFEDLRKKGYEI